jgi:hypothetical protein
MQQVVRLTAIHELPITVCTAQMLSSLAGNTESVHHRPPPCLAHHPLPCAAVHRRIERPTYLCVLTLSPPRQLVASGRCTICMEEYEVDVELRFLPCMHM